MIIASTLSRLSRIVCHFVQLTGSQRETLALDNNLVNIPADWEQPVINPSVVHVQYNIIDSVVRSTNYRQALDVELPAPLALLAY